MTDEGELDDGEPAPAPSSASGPRKRHWWLTLIGLVLVAAVGLGLSWYVAVKRLGNELGSNTKAATLGGNCPKEGQRIWDKMTGLGDLMPSNSSLGTASAAFRRQMAQPTWGVDILITDKPGGSRSISMAKDHDQIEFRPADGSKGVVSSGRVLMSGRNSPFYVESCVDPSFRFSQTGFVRCIRTTTNGDTTTYRLRSVPRDSCSSDAPQSVDRVLTLRGSKVTRWSTTIKGSTLTFTSDWTIRESGNVADPWPWQVVPKWFVNLVE